MTSDLIFWAVVTFVTPLLIAILPLFKFHISERTLHLMLGLSAGILGGVTFVDILPEAFNLATEMALPSVYISFGIALGFFILLVVERYFLSTEQAHGGRFHIHETTIDPRHGPIGISALTIHGFIDGFVIPISFLAGAAVGATVTLAVAIHQIPDSFAGLSLALSTTKKKSKIFLYALITAIDTPIGIIFGAIVTGISNIVIPLGLGIAAGTFIYVSASDLVPELQHSSRSPLVVLSMVGGFLLVVAISLFLPQA